MIEALGVIELGEAGTVRQQSLAGPSEHGREPEPKLQELEQARGTERRNAESRRGRRRLQTIEREAEVDDHVRRASHELRDRVKGRRGSLLRCWSLRCVALGCDEKASTIGAIKEMEMLRIIRVVGSALALLCAGLGTAPSTFAQAPTQQSGFCWVGERTVTGPPTTYVSATFTTPWPVTTSLESRFQSFVESKYGITVNTRTQCAMGQTMAWAQEYRLKLLGPAPQPGYRYVETGWAPEEPTQQSVAPTQTPPSAPSPSANESPAATTAIPIAIVPPSGTFVICKSDFNTDRQRFYNPPVDGRGGGYGEWQESYRKYLEQTYHHTSTNLACSKYPTQAAAQADYDSWLTGARASPSPDINGVPSPIFITSWKY